MLKKMNTIFKKVYSVLPLKGLNLVNVDKYLFKFWKGEVIRDPVAYEFISSTHYGLQSW